MNHILNNLSKRDFVLLNLLFVMLVLWLTFGIFDSFVSGKIADKQRENDDLLTQISHFDTAILNAKITAQTNANAKLSATLAAKEQEFQTLNATAVALKASQSRHSPLSLITLAAAANKVSLVSFTPLEEGFAAVLQGGFGEFLAFLNEVEGQNILLDLTALDIASQQKGVKATLVFKILTF